MTNSTDGIAYQGVIELDRWTPLPGGLYVHIERTSGVSKFYIRVSAEKPVKTGKVRHRKVHQKPLDISGE